MACLRYTGAFVSRSCFSLSRMRQLNGLSERKPASDARPRSLSFKDFPLPRAILISLPAPPSPLLDGRLPPNPKTPNHDSATATSNSCLLYLPSTGSAWCGDPSAPIPSVGTEVLTFLDRFRCDLPICSFRSSLSMSNQTKIFLRCSL